MSRPRWALRGSKVGSPAVRPLGEVLQPVASHTFPPFPGVYTHECSRAGASPVAFCDSLEAGLPKPDLGLGEDGFE